MESVEPMDMRRHPDQPRPREGEFGREAITGLMASVGLHLLAAVIVLWAARAERADRPSRPIDVALVAPARIAANTTPQPASPAPSAAARAAAPRAAPPSAHPPARESRNASAPPAGRPPEIAPSVAAPGPAADGATEASAPEERAATGALAQTSHAPGVPATGNGPPSTEAFGMEVVPMPPGAGGGEAPGYGSIPGAIQRGLAYPALARKMGWEGRVLVSFRILPDGSVRDIRVVEGSGHAILDRNAVEAVRSASPFPRLPETTEVQTPVVFKLN